MNISLNCANCCKVVFHRFCAKIDFAEVLQRIPQSSVKRLVIPVLTRTQNELISNREFGTSNAILLSNNLRDIRFLVYNNHRLVVHVMHWIFSYAFRENSSFWAPLEIPTHSSNWISINLAQSPVYDMLVVQK